MNFSNNLHCRKKDGIMQWGYLLGVVIWEWKESWILFFKGKKAGFLPNRKPIDTLHSGSIPLLFCF
jgi:hypothetical protein